MNTKHVGCGWNKPVGRVFATMIGLLIAAFVLWPATSYAEEQGGEAKADETLKISISFDKKTYAADEKVHAVVTGTNASDEPLRDVSLLVAVPSGYRTSGDTQKTVEKLAAGSSQTLDVYLEPNTEPVPNTNSSADTTKTTGTTTTTTTSKTSLSSTADPSMSVGLLFVEGLIAVAAGVVLIRRGKRGGSTYLVLLCVVALAGGVVAMPATIALAEDEVAATTPSVYDYEVTASTTADVSYGGKTLTLAVTMTGHKRHLPTTASLHIMHINDVHGYYKIDTYNKAIGYSALKALKDQQNPDLLLDAGDTFHGQSFATVTKGESIARLMDEVGVDATTPGNHDWSYGDTRLQQIDSNHDFSILGANITDKDGNAYFKNDYLVRDVVSDEGTVVRVGVFGVIDPYFHQTTPARNVENVDFSDAAERANQMASTLRNELDCDVVIALTHHQNPEQLISQTTGLDAVIAGHQHILINKTSAGDGLVTDKDGHGVALVEAYCYFGYIGTLDLTLNNTDGNGTWDSVDSAETTVGYDAGSQMSDAATDELVATIEDEEKTILDERIGTSSQDYDYPFRNTTAQTIDELKLSWEWLRTRDEPIGHVVTASYLAATGADFSIENVGGIRGGIPQGDVKYQDVLSISPYGNTLETRKLTGAQLREVMEHSLGIMAACQESYDLQGTYVQEQLAAGKEMSQAFEEAVSLYSWPDNSGEVLVLGGAQLTVDWNAQEGSRIKEFKLVKGGELDDSATYIVVMNTYVAGGGNGEYSIITDTELDKEWGTCEMTLRDFVSSDDWEVRVVELTGETGTAIHGLD